MVLGQWQLCRISKETGGRYGSRDIGKVPGVGGDIPKDHGREPARPRLYVLKPGHSGGMNIVS